MIIFFKPLCVVELWLLCCVNYWSWDCADEWHRTREHNGGNQPLGRLTMQSRQLKAHQSLNEMVLLISAHHTAQAIIYVFFLIMISLKLSNNSEWQGLRGNKNFPQNNLHANLKLVMSPDVLWATCEMFLSSEHITLPSRALQGGEGGCWCFVPFRYVAMWRLLNSSFSTVNLHPIEKISSPREMWCCSRKEGTRMECKISNSFKPKAKQKVRVSNINWPLSAKLKCQHNKNILWRQAG